MAEKLTVSEIRTLYEAISSDNLTLPEADKVDFEVKWYMIELIYRDILGIDSDEEAGDGSTISEQLAALQATIESHLAFDQAGYYVGQPTADLKLFSIPTTREFTLPEDCDGSIAKAGTAPHANSTFIIKKNGLQIGTFTFAAGVTTATFSSDETSFSVGDVLEVYAPASQDDDLEDPSWNFKITLEL